MCIRAFVIFTFFSVCIFFNPCEKKESGIFTITGKIAANSYKEKSVRIMLYRITGIYGSNSGICIGDWKEVGKNRRFIFKTPKIIYHASGYNLLTKPVYAHQGPPILRIEIIFFKKGMMPICIEITPIVTVNYSRKIDMGIINLRELEKYYNASFFRLPDQDKIFKNLEKQCSPRNIMCKIGGNPGRGFNCIRAPGCKWIKLRSFKDKKIHWMVCLDNNEINRKKFKNHKQLDIKIIDLLDKHTKLIPNYEVIYPKINKLFDGVWWIDRN